MFVTDLVVWGDEVNGGVPLGLTMQQTLQLFSHLAESGIRDINLSGARSRPDLGSGCFSPQLDGTIKATINPQPRS